MNLMLMFALIAIAPTAIAQDAEQPGRTIQFSGLEWKVKRSDGVAGPGPNLFSDSADNVFLDSQGRLHLRITHDAMGWHCAEVILKKSPGYGEYCFEVDSSPELDPQVILGMFTWHDSDASFHNREIDIELSRWTQPENLNAQFVVQPYETKGNIDRFDMPKSLNELTYQFVWRHDRVDFDAWKRSKSAEKSHKSLHHWSCASADVPPAGGESLHINLWLFRGKSPTNGQSVEMILRHFSYRAN